MHCVFAMLASGKSLPMFALCRLGSGSEMGLLRLSHLSQCLVAPAGTRRLQAVAADTCQGVDKSGCSLV